ncbi:hypothetical protein [Streptomyces antibioticus]|uniref:Uncharacterized protein n=1 Tax=Streptomyces antibioticus TaxID=1890 RepID=A0AAE7CPB6_STRAT|nr:hypothetical protein [Streptomyces antibioticus]OOQ47271.1 hypothetical protein AFM16_31475 [Streptomyces antibioticus]QIT47588.1 hypothetical protein HCX60_32025 [Streptomyces antibioticus]
MSLLPFVSRRRHDALIKSLRADNARLRDQRDRARQDKETAEFTRGRILRQLADADSANKRLHDRTLELGRRISRLTESDPDHLAGLEDRVARLQKGVARYLPALWQARAEVRELTDLAVKAARQLDRMEERVRAAREEGRRAALTVSADEREKAPLDGAPLVRREGPSARLRRAEERCRLLDERVSELQTSHVADTRELHDLRQNGATS